MPSRPPARVSAMIEFSTAAGASPYNDLPTIFTVLRPLGLELRQETATVPVYTVEHIERPSTD